MAGLPPNALAAYKRLTDSGMKPLAAAGLVGNWMAESGMDPTITNKSGAFGIAQDRGSRQTGLLDFAAKRKSTATDLNTQVDYALNELKTTEGNAAKMLADPASLRDAVAGGAAFERPEGFKEHGAYGVNDFDKRMAFAMQIAGLQPGSLPAVAPLPGKSPIPAVGQTVASSPQQDSNTAPGLISVPTPDPKTAALDQVAAAIQNKQALQQDAPMPQLPDLALQTRLKLAQRALGTPGLLG